jgi:hypothetical protein
MEQKNVFCLFFKSPTERENHIIEGMKANREASNLSAALMYCQFAEGRIADAGIYLNRKRPMLSGKKANTSS